jgi:hypothetical protein
MERRGPLRRRQFVVGAGVLGLATAGLACAPGCALPNARPAAPIMRSPEQFQRLV